MKPQTRIWVFLTVLSLLSGLLLSSCGEVTPERGDAFSSLPSSASAEGQPSSVDPDASEAAVFVAEPQLLAENEDCRLWKKEGLVFLEILKEFDFSNLEDRNICMTRSIRFSSIEEMKETLENLSFSEAQLGIMKMLWEPDETGCVPICDPATLSVPDLPEGFRLGEIRLLGRHYTFEYRADVALTGVSILRFNVYDAEAWNEQYVRFSENRIYKDLKVCSETDIVREGLSFRQTICDSGSAITMQRCAIEENDRQYRFYYESYVLREGTTGAITAEEDAVPRTTVILGHEDGQYFYCSFNTAERLPVSALRQYGIHRYAE